MKRWDSAHLSEIESRDGWIPVRAHFGVEAFGINGWRASKAGDIVISEHDENLNRHQELYVVLEGHGTFIVAGEEIDAPAGTLVFVRDPGAPRTAVAREASTTVLAVGAPAGEPFVVTDWEHAWPFTSKAMELYRAERFAEAADVLRDAAEQYPTNAAVLYNLACFESRAGEPVRSVVENLRRAIELSPRFRDYAAGDEDFDPVRGEPEFSELLEGSSVVNG